MISKLYKTAFLIGNANVAPLEIIQRFVPEDSLRVAVDGGAIHFERFGMIPDLVIGDFDSIPGKLLEKYSKLPEIGLRKDLSQNDNDLGKAVKYLRHEGAEKFILTGFSGGREDQYLVNLLFLERTARSCDVILLSETAVVYFIREHFSMDAEIGDTVSLASFNPVKVEETTGLKYPLQDEFLSPGTRGVSNTVIDSEVRINISSGILILFHLYQ